VAGQEAVCGLIVDERIVGQPLDRTAGGTGIEEGVPRRQQAGMLLVELIFEPAEGSLALGGQGHGTVRGPVALARRASRAVAWPVLVSP